MADVKIDISVSFEKMLEAFQQEGYTVRSDLMPKSNRKIIMEQSLYDLLCKMHERAMPDKCILQLLDEKKNFRNPRCERYDCGNSRIGCMNNCTHNYVCCKQCIADYLNEYPF